MLGCFRARPGREPSFVYRLGSGFSIRFGLRRGQRRRMPPKQAALRLHNRQTGQQEPFAQFDAQHAAAGHRIL